MRPRAIWTPAVSKYRNAVMGTSQLVAYWRLGEAAGATTATDAKGTNHGTYAGSPLPTLGQPSATTDTNTSANWSAVGGWVEVPHAAALNLGEDWTIEAWVKPPTLTSAQPRGILSKGVGAYYLRINTAGYLEMAKADTSVIVASTVTLPAGAWRYVVATKNQLGEIKLYINGTDRTGAITGATTVNNTGSLLIGADQQPGGVKREGFAGGIDDVALYSRALTPAEVTAHWKARQ